MKCNKVNMKKVVDALRSGEFIQARGRLKREKGHCCLGVACEIAAREGVCSARRDGDAFMFDNAVYVLPASVREWLGVGSEYILNLLWEGQCYSAITLNDEKECTFDQIADAIEEEYLNGSEA